MRTTKSWTYRQLNAYFLNGCRLAGFGGGGHHKVLTSRQKKTNLELLGVKRFDLSQVSARSRVLFFPKAMFILFWESLSAVLFTGWFKTRCSQTDSMCSSSMSVSDSAPRGGHRTPWYRRMTHHLLWVPERTAAAPPAGQPGELRLTMTVWSAMNDPWHWVDSLVYQRQWLSFRSRKQLLHLQMRCVMCFRKQLLHEESMGPCKIDVAAGSSSTEHDDANDWFAWKCSLESFIFY